MEEKDLTTGTEESQVNVEEHVTEDVQNSEEQVTDVTTDSNYNDAYNDMWEKDVNDVGDEFLSEDTTPVDNPLDVEYEDTSTNNTNNSIGAFMSDKPVVKYKGKDITIDSVDEAIALMQKGLSLEVRAAELKPKEKLLKIVDGIPKETLQAIADLHSGNKDAINYLKSQYGIKDTIPKDNNSFFGDTESTEETSASDYKPAIEADDPIMDFWNEYSTANQVGAAKVNEVYSSLDESFKADVYKPEVFPQFVRSVESGEFDIVYPLAVKEKALNPAMSWIQAYGMAVQKSGVNNTPTEPPVAATPPKADDSGRRMSETSAADRVWNDPEYYKQLEAKLFSEI